MDKKHYIYRKNTIIILSLILCVSLLMVPFNFYKKFPKNLDESLKIEDLTVKNEISPEFLEYEKIIIDEVLNDSPSNASTSILFSDKTALKKFIRQINNKYFYYDQGLKYSIMSYKNNSNKKLIIDKDISLRQYKKSIDINKMTDTIISDLITDKMTKSEAIEIFNDYIINTFEYDADYKYVYQLLTERKGRCSSYAYLMMILCRKVGIECNVLTGYDGDTYHSWNEVVIKNNKYYVDTTFNQTESNKYLLVSYETIDKKFTNIQTNNYIFEYLIK